jgi:hypothetical protein
VTGKACINAYSAAKPCKMKRPPSGGPFNHLTRCGPCVIVKLRQHDMGRILSNTPPCRQHHRPDSLGTAATILYPLPLRRLGNPITRGQARTKRDSRDRAWRGRGPPAIRVTACLIPQLGSDSHERHSFLNSATPGNKELCQKTLTLTNSHHISNNTISSTNIGLNV